MGIFNWLLDIVFPQTCCLCKEGSDAICEPCLQKIEFDPKWEVRSGIKVWSAFDYESPDLQKLMKRWKYQQGGEMLNLWQYWRPLPNVGAQDVVVPVPMHYLRKRERGFNQAEEWADFFSSRTGMPVYNWLERIRNTEQQAHLSREDRLKNLGGAFSLFGQAEGKKIVLIDDVVTTGSTLAECAKVLKEQGKAQEVIAVCLARSGYEKN